MWTECSRTIRLRPCESLVPRTTKEPAAGTPLHIAVIGQVNRDRIVGSDGFVRDGWGGSLYNASALAALFGGEADISVVADLSSDERAEMGSVTKAWRAKATVSFSGIEGGGANRAELRYEESGMRSERTEVRGRPFTWPEIERAASADVVVANFIGGNELSLETWIRLKQKRAGLLLLDLHTLNRPVGAGGLRVRRPIPEMKSWVQGVDVVQGSGEELSDLLGGRLAVPTTPGYLPPGWRKAIGTILGAGARSVVLTLGTAGAWAGYAYSAGRARFIWQAAFPVEPVDVTGCGDTFTAGFVFGVWTSCKGAAGKMRGALSRSTGMRDALRWGAAAAAEKACRGGLLASGRGAVEQIFDLGRQ